MKDVTLWVHWKQGDDFAHHLEHAKGNSAAALKSWSESLQDASEKLHDIAGVVADYPMIEMSGDTHHVGFQNVPDEALERLQLLELVCVQDIEDEFEDESTGEFEYLDEIADEDVDAPDYGIL